jgi:hypothetical protein
MSLLANLRRWDSGTDGSLGNAESRALGLLVDFVHNLAVGLGAIAYLITFDAALTLTSATNASAIFWSVVSQDANVEDHTEFFDGSCFLNSPDRNHMPTKGLEISECLFDVHFSD